MIIANNPHQEYQKQTSLVFWTNLQDFINKIKPIKNRVISKGNPSSNANKHAGS
jgi:hypothetical protein